MKKRERKHHNKKKMTRAIVNILRVNIQASIDNEIIKTLMAMGAGEIDIPVDLIPFNINDKINY
jgi:hypothetical protein